MSLRTRSIRASRSRLPAPSVLSRELLHRPEVRARYWARSLLGWPRFSSAQPNAAHHALATMERTGAVVGLIPVKPNVVFFGDNVPPPTVEAAFTLLAEADALLVVGSSLAVYSGFRFVTRAAERHGIDGAFQRDIGAVLPGEPPTPRPR